jgi:polygalacturonase
VKVIFFIFSLVLVLNLPSETHAQQSKGPIHCDVKDFGAKGDGKTKDTNSIQGAIDSCARTGGQVELHDGIFLSGMIRLKSGVILNIQPTATLKGSQDDNDYPTLSPPTNNSQLLNCRKALVYAESVNNIVIQGGGTIDGSGSNPRWKGKEATRPMAIFIATSQNVIIQLIKVINSGMWSVVNMETDNLIVRGITVHSPDGPTRDGIDIVDCHHVLVEKNEIFSEDDAICIKSGSPKGVFDVMVRDNNILQSSVANGLKLGTASSGSFKKVIFKNIQMQNVKQAAMAVESVDGGSVDDIEFHNIRFKQTGSAIYVLLGRRGIGPTGSIKNILFDGVEGSTNSPWGSAISGTQSKDGVHYLQNIKIQNFNVVNATGLGFLPTEPPEYSGQYPDPRLWGDLPSYGLFLRHINGLNISQKRIQSSPGERRPQVIQRDVTH